MADLKKIVYLTEAQKEELFTNNTVTANGVTVTFNADDLYVTSDSGSAPIVDGNGMHRKVWATQNATVPTGATAGDIVLVETTDASNFNFPLVNIASQFAFTNTGSRGSLNVLEAYKCGPMVSISIRITNTTTVNEGYNICEGTFTSGPLPIPGIIAVSYYFGYVWELNFNQNRTCVVRNVKGQATTGNTPHMDFHFCYLTNE